MPDVAKGTSTSIADDSSQGLSKSSALKSSSCKSVEDLEILSKNVTALFEGMMKQLRAGVVVKQRQADLEEERLILQDDDTQAELKAEVRVRIADREKNRSKLIEPASPVAMRPGKDADRTASHTNAKRMTREDLAESMKIMPKKEMAEHAAMSAAAAGDDDDDSSSKDNDDNDDNKKKQAATQQRHIHHLANQQSVNQSIGSNRTAHNAESTGTTGAHGLTGNKVIGVTIQPSNQMLQTVLLPAAVVAYSAKCHFQAIIPTEVVSKEAREKPQQPPKITFSQSHCQLSFQC